MKAVSFVGSSLDDLRRFPKDAKHDIGQQIALIQSGVNPRQWRPMPNVGRGVREFRVRDAGKAYRSMYTTTIGDRGVYPARVREEVAEDRKERSRNSQETLPGGDRREPIVLANSRISILLKTLFFLEG